MNITLKVIALSAITALVVALGVVGYVGHQSATSGKSFGTQVQNDLFWFVNGITVGNQGQLTIDSSGNITQSKGTTALNDIVEGSAGFSSTLATSTTLTAAQFCATTNQRWLGTTALATATLPSATSAYAVCGSLYGFGARSTQLVTNDSTNTVNFVAGSGTTFKCETGGVGTSTVTGVCTSSQVSLLATSTVFETSYWDGASSSLIILWGNNYH